MKNVKLSFALLFLLIAAMSCGFFPLHSSASPLGIIKGLILLFGCFAIGESFVKLWGPGRALHAGALTAVFVAVGIAVRFLLERGSDACAVNFTPVNVLLFLAVIPLGSAAAYLYTLKQEKKK